MSFLLGYAQDVGSRDRQEDYLAEKQISNMHLAVLADGMGGHEGGDQASDIVTQGFIRYVEQQAHRYPEMAELLVDAVYSANSHLAQLKRNPASNMGSTLVALLARETHAWWVSVGDSLLYLWRNNQLQKLNAKHSHYQDLRQKVFLKEISSRQASSDPQRDGLTSALAGREIKYVDVSRFGIDLQPGDRFILASDGLETLSIEQITAILQKGANPQQIADGLVQKIKLAGNLQQDNISVVIVEASLQQNANIKPELRTVANKKNRFRSPLVVALGGLLIGGMLGFGAGMQSSPQPDKPQGKEAAPAKDNKKLSLASDSSPKCSEEAERAVAICQEIFNNQHPAGSKFCPDLEAEAKKRCENPRINLTHLPEPGVSAASQTNTAQPILTHTGSTGPTASGSAPPSPVGSGAAPLSQKPQIENSRLSELPPAQPNSRTDNKTQQNPTSPVLKPENVQGEKQSNGGVRP